jgi:hypothetical protein
MSAYLRFVVNTCVVLTFVCICSGVYCQEASNSGKKVSVSVISYEQFVQDREDEYEDAFDDAYSELAALFGEEFAYSYTEEYLESNGIVPYSDPWPSRDSVVAQHPSTSDYGFFYVPSFIKTKLTASSPKAMFQAIRGGTNCYAIVVYECTANSSWTSFVSKVFTTTTITFEYPSLSVGTHYFFARGISDPYQASSQSPQLWSAPTSVITYQISY